MQIKKQFINRSLLISILITIIYFGLTIIFKGVYYRINDDLTIRRILSGEYAGVPSQYVYGVNIYLCMIMKYMYSLIPGIDFWGWFLLFCYAYLMITFIFLLYKQISRKCNKWLAVICLVTIFSCLYGREVIFISFTGAGTVCGIISIQHLIMAKLYSDNRKIETLNKILSIFFCFLSFCIRKETFFMISPFIVLFLCIEYRENVISIVKYILLVAVGVVILSYGHNTTYSAPEWESYIEFRDGRKVVHDYVGFPSYSKNKEFYDELGIQEYEYECFKSGIVNTVLDYNVSMEVIYDAIIEEYTSTVTLDHFKASLKSLIKKVVSDQERCIWIVMIGVTMIPLFIQAIRKKDISFRVALLGINLFVLFEWIYLAYKGRYTYIVINCMTVMWLFMLILLLFWKGNEEAARAKTYYLFICSLIYLLITAPLLVEDIETYQDANNSTDIINEYCKSYPDNSYFCPAVFMSNTTDQIGFKFDNSFENRIVMGGWNAFSLTYEEKLKTCGLSLDVEKEILYNDNVYIISDSNRFAEIDGYFEAKYDKYTYEIVDTINTISFGEVNVYSLKNQ